MLNLNKSVAVLPFVNMSNDSDNEYFSDGMTEEIINALTTINGLKVIARTSCFAFKGKNIDVRTVGKQLGVATLLEGSVRKFKNKLRITAQLIRTDDGTHLWSKNFDRTLDDIFALQDEISLLIADQIRENFGHFEIQDQLIAAPTDNIDAYQFFLKGRFFQRKWELPAIEKAIHLYQTSLELDPQYDQPYFGAGLCYSLLGSWGYMNKAIAFAKAEQYLSRGKKIGNLTVSGYFGLAVHDFWGFWDYKKGHQALVKGLAINNQDAETIDFLAEINRSIGDFSTGLSYVNKGLSVNPLSTNAHYTKATLYYLQGLFERALSVITDGLTIDPRFSLLLQLKLGCLIQLGKKAELIKVVKENISLEVPQLYLQLYHLFHQENLPDEDTIKDTIQRINALPSPMLYPWDIYLTLYSKQKEKALSLLQAKVNAKMGQVANFKNDPLLKPIQQEPLYLQLVQSNFPANSLEAIELSPLKAQGKDILTPQEVEKYTAALTQQMEEEALYLEPDLRLKDLAETIGIHPNKLSWLLNENTDKNFNEYINSYRLKTFKSKAINPANSHLTLLGLAYESGFNSKTVFNSFFKKVEGTTPRAWLKSQMSK